MRKITLAVFGVIVGCGDISPPGVGNVWTGDPPAGAERVDEPPLQLEPPAVEEQEATNEPQEAGPSGCAYTVGLEPKLPELSGTDCRREWRDVSGNLVQYADAIVTPDSITRTTAWPNGEPGWRHHERVGPFGATHRFVDYLDPTIGDTLPCTYGQPSTFGERMEYDDAGRMVRHEYDYMLDDSVDHWTEWEFDELGQLVELRRLDWDRTYVEHYRPDGQPTFKGVLPDSGTFYSYDNEGLLTSVEQRNAGVPYRREVWTMLDTDRPMTQTVQQIVDGEAFVEASSAWEYDSEGRLRVETGMRVVYGYPRTHRREFDTSGNEVFFGEYTEDSSCHAYERRQTWRQDGQLERSRTTCDETLYSEVDVEFDRSGRPTFQRSMYHGSGNASPRTTRWTYDACGALASVERRYGDIVSSRVENTWDSEGRLIERLRVYQQDQSQHQSFAYDAEGRVTQFGSVEIQYDASGRIVRIGNPPSYSACAEFDPAHVVLHLTYCDE